MPEFGASDSQNPLSAMREDDLARMESLLGLYFNSSTLGFCILDADFRYVAINQALAGMHGLLPEAHMGKTVREVLGPFADQVEPKLRQVLATADARLDVRVSGAPPGKQEPGNWINHYFPIKYGADGGVERIGAIVLEVTQQRRMEATVNHLRKSVKQQMDRLQMLMDVGGILASNWNIKEVFPRISARIRRVLRQEYAGFSLHDAAIGTLVRQSEDFPLGKGLTAEVQISASNGPGARSLEARSSMIFSQEQMRGFSAEIAQRFLEEGLRSLCCVRAAVTSAGPTGGSGSGQHPRERVPGRGLKPAEPGCGPPRHRTGEQPCRGRN